MPTEAEWEFAARCGLAGKTYAWGDEFKPGAKFHGQHLPGTISRQDTGEDGFAGLAPVKSFPPNGCGLYDMSGNGAATGIGLITFCNSPQPAQLHATREALRVRLILPSPACINACEKAVPFSALTSIAHGTWWELVARASPAPPPITPLSLREGSKPIALTVPNNIESKIWHLYPAPHGGPVGDLAAPSGFALRSAFRGHHQAQ